MLKDEAFGFDDRRIIFIKHLNWFVIESMAYNVMGIVSEPECSRGFENRSSFSNNETLVCFSFIESIEDEFFFLLRKCNNYRKEEETQSK